MALALSSNWMVGVALIGAVAAASSFIYQRIVDRRRTRDYTEHCLARGLRFEHDRPGEEARHARTCHLFGEGYDREWCYTITGERSDVPYMMFEYRWTTGYFRNSYQHTIGGVLWTVRRDLPDFILTPAAKPTWWFGGQDIDFADSPQFSDAYRLRAPNEAAVRALFPADVRRAFERDREQHVAGAGKELLLWRNDRLPPSEGLDQFLMEADRIRQLFDRPA